MFVFCHVIYYASICQNTILSNSQKNWFKKIGVKTLKFWCKKRKNFSVKKKIGVKTSKHFGVKKYPGIFKKKKKRNASQKEHDFSYRICTICYC